MNLDAIYIHGDGQRHGPFLAHDVLRWVSAGELTGRESYCDSDNEPLKIEKVRRMAESQIAPPPAPLARQANLAWNPMHIALLGIILTPLWSGVMASINARRLGLTVWRWPPVLVGSAWLAADVVVAFSPVNSILTHALLLLAAVWLMWYWGPCASKWLPVGTRCPCH